MRILARAHIAGYVTAVAPAAGTIELAGLQIHMEHGAVVNPGDFVQIEASLSVERVWAGRIQAHFVSGDPAAGQDVSPAAHTAQSATRLAAPLPAPSSGSAPPAAPESSGGDAGSSATQGGTGSAAGALPPSTPPATGRRRFTGSSGARGPAGTGPAASAGAQARPRFTPSSADHQVKY